MIKVICDMCGREIPRYDRIKLKPEYDQMLVPMDYSDYLNSYDLHMDCYKKIIKGYLYMKGEGK